MVRRILVLCGLSELLARMLMVPHAAAADDDDDVVVLRGGVRILWRTDNDAHEPCIGPSTTAAFAFAFAATMAVTSCNKKAVARGEK